MAQIGKMKKTNNVVSHNGRKKPKREEIIEYENPFDSLYFWLTLATTNFGFFDNEKQDVNETDEQHKKK